MQPARRRQSRFSSAPDASMDSAKGTARASGAPLPSVSRMRAIVGHLAAGKSPLQASQLASTAEPAVLRPIPARSDATRWNGWGFRDTRMFLNADKVIEVSGDRYPEMFPPAAGAAQKRLLPLLLPWSERTIGLSPARRSPAAVVAAEELRVVHASPYASADDGSLDAFLAALAARGLRVSQDLEERVRHGHGQTCEDIFRLRHRREIERVPDAVVWPRSHADVEALVALTVERSDRVCLFPFGGGTNVTNALDCRPDERRAIVSVDMGAMSRILRIDKENLLVTVEAGATGFDLHERLALLGLTLGHEPDSWEFSTLGGWVATRASGMKKNRYGNIEDLVVTIKAVTARGTLSRAADAPRVSMGPDAQQMLLGSEGMLGIVTEVTLRASRVPQCQVYDSFIFPDFASGVAMLHEATRAGCVPASLRLMDNTQFQLGQVLKPSSTAAPSTSVIDYAKKTYVTKVRGFQVDNMCAATVMMEGTREEVAAQQAALHAIAKRHGGLAGGPENGKRGYHLTYLIAYLRDFALDYFFLSESFESAVPWSHARAVCRDVTRAINSVAASFGVIAPPLVACRISQVYATGVCVYVYYGVNYYGVSDPLSLFRATEKAAVDAMVANGAALSHHHGIGKHRREWLEQAVSTPAVAVLHGVKRALDPSNVFATDNLLLAAEDRSSRL